MTPHPLDPVAVEVSIALAGGARLHKRFATVTDAILALVGQLGEDELNELRTVGLQRALRAFRERACAAAPEVNGHANGKAGTNGQAH